MYDYYVIFLAMAYWIQFMRIYLSIYVDLSKHDDSYLGEFLIARDLFFLIIGSNVYPDSTPVAFLFDEWQWHAEKRSSAKSQRHAC